MVQLIDDYKWWMGGKISIQDVNMEWAIFLFFENLLCCEMWVFGKTNHQLDHQLF